MPTVACRYQDMSNHNSVEIPPQWTGTQNIHINSQVIKEGKNSKTFMSQLHCLSRINPLKCYSVNFPNTWIFKQADFVN